MDSVSEPSTKSLANLPVVTLKKRRAQPFLNRHPWVFAGAIARVDGDPDPGAEVVVRSNDGQFIARGLFNQNSNIRVRLYSWEKKTPLDGAFWSARISEAISLRRQCIDTERNSAYRLFFSESDGISGLTVDRYEDWLLVQITSLAIAERSEMLFDLLMQQCGPRGIWLRTEKGIREAEGLQISDGLVRGEEPPQSLTIRENGLPFLVDPAHGQKTGCFLDQRENRRAVASYVEGQRVLDAFCYAGGFGVTAAKLGHATSVVCVDSSETALELARANAEANGITDRIEFVRSDVFRYLEQCRDNAVLFDTVILDPPKMARGQKGIDNALRGYHGLNVLGASLVKPGGLLVTCSCSGHVSRADFGHMLAEVSTSIQRRIQVLEARGLAADHPVSPNCPENDYLKCFICLVV